MHLAESQCCASEIGSWLKWGIRQVCSAQFPIHLLLQGVPVPHPVLPSAVALEMCSLRSLFLFSLSLLAWLSCQWQRKPGIPTCLLLPVQMIRNGFILKGVWLFTRLLSIFTLLLNSFLIYYCFYCPFLSVSKDQRYWKHLPRKAPYEVLHLQNSCSMHCSIFEIQSWGKLKTSQGCFAV